MRIGITKKFMKKVGLLAIFPKANAGNSKHKQCWFLGCESVLFLLNL